jgi:hypothetical protein
MTGVSPVRAAFLGFGLLALLIAANLWAFRALAGTNYLVWYLKNGSAVALGASFLALVWDGLDLHEDLLSAHPLRYLRGCFALLGILFFAAGAHLSSPLQGTKGNADDLGSAVGIVFDGLVSVLVNTLIGLVVVGWLLVVAPLNYVVTLFSGVLARQELRGQVLRPIVVPDGPAIRLQSQPVGDPLPDRAIDVSLARKPFAITQAITSLLLWIAGLALPLMS